MPGNRKAAAEAQTPAQGIPAVHETGADNPTPASGGAATQPNAAVPTETTPPTGALSQAPAPLPQRPSRAKKLLRTMVPATPAGGPKQGTNDRGSKRSRAEMIARRTVGKLVSDPSPSTEPVPIVAFLKGTAYQAPVESTAKSENEARMILDLAADLGAMMLRAGAGSSESEISVIAVCAAMGLPDTEIDLTSTSLTVHYSDPEGRLMTVVRVVREESIHFAKLSSIHNLVSTIVDGELDYDDARARLDSIRQQKRPWPEWFARAAWGLLAAAFVQLIGGSLISSLLGFGMAVLNDLFGKYLFRSGIPPFFVFMTQAGASTIVAMLAYTFHLIASPEYMVGAGIVLLLPTVTLISGVQDSLTEFPLTAAGRFVRLGVSLGGIVSGIALALYLGKLINLRPIEVVVQASGLEVLTTVIAMISAFLVAAAGSIGFQAARRTILLSGLIGISGFILYVALSVVGAGNILTCFLAAAFVGFLCRPIALRRGQPVIVLLIPAIFPLLQGLSIFRAVFEIVQPEEAVSLATGLSALFAALAANAALAVGATLGDFLSRPLAKRRRAQFTPAEAENQVR